MIKTITNYDVSDNMEFVVLDKTGRVIDSAAPVVKVIEADDYWLVDAPSNFNYRFEVEAGFTYEVRKVY